MNEHRLETSRTTSPEDTPVRRGTEGKGALYHILSGMSYWPLKAALIFASGYFAAGISGWLVVLVVIVWGLYEGLFSAGIDDKLGAIVGPIGSNAAMAMMLLSLVVLFLFSDYYLSFLPFGIAILGIAGGIDGWNLVKQRPRPRQDMDPRKHVPGELLDFRVNPEFVAAPVLGGDMA